MSTSGKCFVRNDKIDLCTDGSAVSSDGKSCSTPTCGARQTVVDGKCTECDSYLIVVDGKCVTPTCDKVTEIINIKGGCDKCGTDLKPS